MKPIEAVTLDYSKWKFRIKNGPDFDDFWERYGAEVNQESWATWLSVAGFFNGISVLIERRLLDISLVEELLSNITIRSWSIMVSVIEKWRESSIVTVRPTRKYKLMHGFEYLHNEFMKREQQAVTKL